MTKITVVVREIGRFKPDYAVDFEVPGIPAIGSYLSIHRPDKREPYGEDLVVRKVWWRLEHPETRGATTGTPKVGSLIEVFVECDVATGPYSSDAWLKTANRAREGGAFVEAFEVARYSIREADLQEPPI